MSVESDLIPSRATPLIEAEHVSVSFAVRNNGLRRGRRLHAVRDVSIAIQPGETYGLVGESGSGKSTTGRALLRLTAIESGAVRLDGRDITSLGERQLRPLRREMQMVFQDPYSSLDPSAVIADIIGEPLQVHDGLRGQRRDARVRELLEQVGLSPTYLERYPYEFSGGQRQRIAIARAIALNPKLIVLDEAVSALDVSTQNQILELLQQLREQLGVTYLFISHNLAVVRWLADRVAVMYLGRVVEEGPTEAVYSSPAHPYTRSLLAAVPLPDPSRQRHRPPVQVTGDIPDPLHPPRGCAFHHRCPDATEICAVEQPQRRDLPGGGWVACHLHRPTSDHAGR